MSELNVYRVAQLTLRLCKAEKELLRIAERRDRYVNELVLVDPRKPNKPRSVIEVVGSLRKIQDRLYESVFLPALAPSAHGHGGVRGRSIKTNAKAHLGSQFIFKADIANFYPSISVERLRAHLIKNLGCSASAADWLAKVCSYDGHLALGLVTSPILADSILRTIDTRIAAACEKLGLVFTRYVDDITISGPFDLSDSGLPGLLDKVLRNHGFEANQEKHIFGSIETTPITGIRIRNGRLDIAKEYALELERQLDDAASLATQGDFNGPFFTENQIRGRITYVCWVNPRRRKALQKRLASICWEEHRAEGMRRKLVAAKKKVARRDAFSTAVC